MTTPGFADPLARRVSELDLSRLLDEQAPLQWFEAVAVTQELCAAFVGARGAGPPAALEPGDIVITAEGGVQIRGRGAQDVPTVPQVAHILLALVEGTQALPVQLRLFALQEVSPTPACATLREFSERLVPFERPNRRNTIRDVYQRFTQLQVREFERVATEPAGARRDRPAARPPWWRNRKLRSAAASAALLVAAGVAVALLWQAVAPLLSGRDEKQTAGPAQDRGALSAADVERIWATARRIWSRTGPRPPAPAPEAAAEPSPVIVPVLVSPPKTAAPAPPATSPVAGASPGTGPTTADTTVFSAANAEVVPPALVRPRLPTIPKAGGWPADLPQVEVVVSPTGEVESVKLLTHQASVSAAMMLSAIKTWRFAPAARAGRPVRYRMVIPLTNQ